MGEKWGRFQNIINWEGSYSKIILRQLQNCKKYSYSGEYGPGSQLHGYKFAFSPCRGDSLNWMYKGEKPDTEEYLLGRKIDRHVEGQEQPEERNGMVLKCKTKF